MHFLIPLEEDYSSDDDDDESEEQTAEGSDDDNDNNYQGVVEQPRKHLQGTIEFLKTAQN